MAPTRYHPLQRKHHASPARMIIGSFLLVLLICGSLLCLPISHDASTDVAPIDAFFTAISAVCVTGLVTVTTATSWSIWGKIIILVLIQIGGLTLITIYTFLIIHFGKKVTLGERLVIQSAFNVNDLGGLVRMVLFVIKGTLLFEGVGAAVLFGCFIGQSIPMHKALFYGISHSVSAFCNAGFDLLGEQSLIPYSGHVVLNLVVMVLIVVGGIGFTVWHDIYGAIKSKFQRKAGRAAHFSLHSKLAITGTLVLLVFGALYFLLAEYANPATLGRFTFPQKVLAACFQSVTLRTAGFASIDQGAMHIGSKLFSCILMLIGGSPGGTAGGIKTVSMAILLVYVWSAMKARREASAFGRSLPHSALQKVLVMFVVISALWLGGSIFLSFTEMGGAFPHSMIDLMFEAASALGTVGLTAGITPFLSPAGKLLMMLFMFIGRIGPITIAVSLNHRSTHAEDHIQHPSENVIIG